MALAVVTFNRITQVSSMVPATMACAYPKTWDLFFSGKQYVVAFSSSCHRCQFMPCFHLQIKRKLPKVNRLLAARLLEDEEAEAEAEVNTVDDSSTKKKTSKKRKVLGSELLKDERFAVMFENKVLSTYLCCIWIIQC